MRATDETRGRVGAGVAARLRGDLAFRVLVLALSLIAVVPLALILVYIIAKGASSINWQFLTQLPKPMGEAGGGISNAIVGTLILIGIASLISIPLGVTAGIFLSERSRTRLGTFARLSVETLMGIPSIVLGIVTYTWIVRPMGHFSALAGGVSLAMIMLPVITLSTEETLLLIPMTLREAALALGVSYPPDRHARHPSRRHERPGHRHPAGRGPRRGGNGTASFHRVRQPLHGGERLEAHGVAAAHDLLLRHQSVPEWQALAWGASFVLLVMVLALNIVTKLVTSRWKTQF